MESHPPLQQIPCRRNQTNDYFVWIPFCADGADDDTVDEGAATAVAEADNADTLAVQTDANNTKHLMMTMLLMMLGCFSLPSFRSRAWHSSRIYNAS